MTKTDFLRRQLEMLEDKFTGGDTQWCAIADLREGYNHSPESYDTIRKGGKIIGEYINAGWRILPPDEEMEFTYDASNKLSVNYLTGENVVEKKMVVQSNDVFKDEKYLLESNGYPAKLWKITKLDVTNREVVSTDKILCTVKMAVKPRDVEVTDVDLESWLARLAEDYARPTNMKHDPISLGDKMLLINIADLHYNLQSTPFTSGDTYNEEVAEDYFWSVLCDIIDRTDDKKFEKIIFTIGGDGLNADNIAGTTTKGTSQDNALPFFDAVEKYFNMIVRGIEELGNIAPVEVIYIPGNHDKTVGFMLAKYVAAWFRFDKRVSVDYTPLPRKYTKFGNTLFAFAHDGDKKNTPRLIADEAREFWSDTNFTEVMLQHFHHETLLLEEYNMRMQQLPSVCGTSTWTNEQGYRAKKQCKTFIYDKEKGLTDVLYTVV